MRMGQYITFYLLSVVAFVYIVFNFLESNKNTVSEIMSFQHEFWKSYMLNELNYMKCDWWQIRQLSTIFEFLTAVTFKEIYDTVQSGSNCLQEHVTSYRWRQ